MRKVFCKEGIIMTHSEAKEYFKRYYGKKFFMYREEPERFEEYERRDISLQTEENWRQEIIHELFDSFFDKPLQIWVIHGRLVDVLLRTTTKIEENCGTLLDLMERIDSDDIVCRVHIIEKMAGYNDDASDGGCRFICTQTSHGVRMDGIMRQLCALPQVDWRQWSEYGERFAAAVRRYNRAYKMYGKAE